MRREITVMNQRQVTTRTLRPAVMCRVIVEMQVVEKDALQGRAE